MYEEKDGLAQDFTISIRGATLAVHDDMWGAGSNDIATGHCVHGAGALVVLFMKGGDKPLFAGDEFSPNVTVHKRSVCVALSKENGF